MTHILTTEACLQMELRGQVLIEASAGTGKTYTIANLYLRLISEGHQVSQILVVTFTVAATDELRGRIRQRLHVALRLLESATEPDDDPFLQLWWQQLADRELTARRLRLAVRSMDEAAIYTIHAFCQRALGEHAFRSRQRFDNEMLSDDSAIWQQAVYDWWRSHVYPLDEVAAGLLLRVLPDVATLQALMDKLRDPTIALLSEEPESPDEVMAEVSTLTQAWSELARSWQADGERLYRILLNSPALSRSKSKKPSYHQEKLPDLRRQWDDDFAGHWWDCSPCLEQLSAEVIGKHLKKSAPDPALEDAFFLRCGEWLRQLAALEQRLLVAVVHQARQVICQQVEQSKERQGVMAFQDQLQRLDAALSRDETLATVLRQRFPLAMIDEFQDTDGLQYAIFRRIYRPQDCLMMIGDPKQAIYAFRGGDIFTYLQAASEAAQRWTLATNWRSSPELVTTVNRLFSRPQAFVMEGIDFQPAEASGKPVPVLTREGQPVAAVRALRIPHAGNKNEAASQIFHHLASDIACCLQEAGQGRALLGERPVRADDIAVLVHTHAQAEVMQQALRAHGIAAATAGKGDIWQSEEAEGLRHILQAVAEPASPERLRLALASSLLSLRWQEMVAWQQDAERWRQWSAAIAELHELWQRHGFMAMFQHMLEQLQINRYLACSEQAERRLTNVLHLGELLQAASLRSTGMHGLLQQFDVPAKSEEKELRLESDEQLVRIVTIHASKGLEYPIVYLPTLWQAPGKGGASTYRLFRHRQQHRRCCALGREAEHETFCHWAKEEELAEQVRVLYVALTRAQSHMVLVHGAVGRDFKDSGGYYLWPDGMSQWLPEDEWPLAEAAQAVAREAAHHAPEAQDRVGDYARFEREFGVPWQVGSFTAMTRHLAHPVVTREASAVEESTDVFPAGAATGIVLHSLLERLDFSQEVTPDALRHLAKHLARVGLDPALAPLLATWLETIGHTPLHADGWSLADVPTGQILRELEFDLPVSLLKLSSLDACLQAHAATTLPALPNDTLRGYLTGSIDALLCMDGRYYVVDYKSNRLADYQPASLRQAMHAHRYDLQALIYTLAAHRFLQLRLPDYDYQRHFGGVRYLFLRGMRGQILEGVYSDAFTLAEINSVLPWGDESGGSRHDQSGEEGIQSTIDQ